MHSQEHLGPTDVFMGAMAAPSTRKAKTIKIINTAVFTVLTFQFPAGGTGAANAKDVTGYPALTELHYVKSFQLASGDIQVIYDY